MTTPRGQARRLLAAALQIDRADHDGCDCAVCGPASPYTAAGVTARVLGPGFADHAVLEAPACPQVCVGCRRLLSGRPGDTPPPLRTRSIAVIAGALHILTTAECWELLCDPPADLALLSWAESRQKHHVLYAEIGSAIHLRIGSDAETINYRPAGDQALREAVETLRAGATRDEILSGHYRAPTITRMGAAVWAAAEAVVAPRRGEAVTRMLVMLAAPRVAPPGGQDFMLTESDQMAIQVLGSLAHGSTLRLRDGLRFWGSLYERRIVRHMARDLPTFISRLLLDLEVPPTSPDASALAVQVETLSAEQSQALMQAIRRQPTLLVALAFDRHKRARSGRAPSAKGRSDYEQSPAQ